MLSAKTLKITIPREYKNWKEAEQNRRDRKKEPPLSKQECQYQLADIQRHVLMNMTVPSMVKPEVMEELFRQAIPSLESVSDDERRNRRTVQIRAVSAYAATLFHRFCPVIELDGGKYPEAHVDACRLLESDDRELYVRCVAQSQPEYYIEHPIQSMTAQAISEAIYESQRTIHRLMCKAVNKAIETCRDLEKHALTDEDLINNYPDMAASLQLLGHAHDLLKEAGKYRLDTITPAQLERAEVRADAILAHAALAEQHLALMADPEYPFVKVENMLEANTAQLDHLKDVLSKKKLVSADLRAGDNARPGQKISENLIELTSDIARIKQNSLHRRLAAALGMSREQMADNMLFCDKNGNITDIHQVTAEEMFRHTGGEFYVISKFGSRPPMPVMIERTDRARKILVGTEEIVGALKNAQNLSRPQSPGFMTRMVNWFSRTFQHRPSRDMQVYNINLANYELLQTMQQISTGKYPDSVNDQWIFRTQKNRELEKERETVRKEIRQGLEYLHYVPEVKEAEFRKTLGLLLIRKAHTEDDNSMFRCTVFDLLGRFNGEYTPGAAEHRLVTSDLFREFVHDLCTHSTELVEELRSGDPEKADHALTDICGRFRLHFAAGSSDRWSKPVGWEYQQFRKDQEKEKAKLEASRRQVKSLMSESDARVMEQERNNAYMWKSIECVYGGKRPLRTDWVTIWSSHAIYDMDTWTRIKQNEVNVGELLPDNQTVSERTFASLAMILSLHPHEYYAEKNINIPDTQFFEDIVSTNGGPRYTLDPVFDAVADPTRLDLKDRLAQMSSQDPKKAEEAKAQLAQDLAKSLKLFAGRMANGSWKDRTYSVLAQVGGEVLKFAEAHGMTGLLRKNLTQEELDQVKITCALGEIANEAYNAEDDLRLDYEQKKPLTPKQRQICINRIMLLKAIQADVNGHRQELTLEELEKAGDLKNVSHDKTLLKLAAGKKDVRYPTATADYILNHDQSALTTLSLAMLPDEDRQKLAAKGSKDIYQTVRCRSSVGSIDDNWAEMIRKNPTAEPDILRVLVEKRDELRQFEKRMTELCDDPKYQRVAPAALQVLKTGDPLSKLALLSLNDTKLQGADHYMGLASPGTVNFNEDLKAYGDRNREQLTSTAPKAADPAPRPEDPAPKGDPLVVPHL